MTGIAFVALQDKGTNTTPLKIEQGQDYRVIKTAPSFFLRLDTTLTKLTDSLRHLSDSMRSLLDPDNLRSIKQSLTNIRDFTATLSGNRQQLNTMLRNTAAASNQLAPLLQSTDSTLSRFLRSVIIYLQLLLK